MFFRVPHELTLARMMIIYILLLLLYIIMMMVVVMMMLTMIMTIVSDEQRQGWAEIVISLDSPAYIYIYVTILYMI